MRWAGADSLGVAYRFRCWNWRNTHLGRIIEDSLKTFNPATAGSNPFFFSFEFYYTPHGNKAAAEASPPPVIDGVNHAEGKRKKTTAPLINNQHLLLISVSSPPFDAINNSNNVYKHFPLRYAIGLKVISLLLLLLLRFFIIQAKRRRNWDCAVPVLQPPTLGAKRLRSTSA